MREKRIRLYPTLYYEIRKRGLWYRDTQSFCQLVWDLYQPESVADVGCGPGVYLKCLSDLGVKDILGVEGSQTAIKTAVTEHIVEHDLRVPFVAPRSFRLVLCIEVIEHIEAPYSTVVLETIVALCGNGARLIFTAAPPGQVGFHHVNLRPKSYWIHELEKKGFSFSTEETRRLTESFNPKIVFWVKKNVMCFRYLDASMATYDDPAIYRQPRSIVKNVGP